MHWYPRYLSIGARRATTLPEMRRLRERGVRVQPVEGVGQAMARDFWGRRWCERLDTFARDEARLPLGRTLVRRGSVCHLEVRPGVIEAMVAGSALFRTVVRIRAMDPTARLEMARACAGRVGSVPELLRGALPEDVIEAVAGSDRGVLPRREEIHSECGCPDGKTLCRHAAAALYGVGRRLDAEPELLFRLRNVDAAELIASATAPKRASSHPDGENAPGPGSAPAEVSPPAAVSPPAEVSPPAALPDDPIPAGLAGSGPAGADAAPARPEGGPAAPADEDGDGFRPTGAFIRGLRRSSGFSVPEFAALLRVSAATVRRWEAAPGALTLRSRPRDALETLLEAIEGSGT
ncbi:MAG: hypothetical protein OXH04_09480 [Acidobacteria bacterium]|nr:hypothetical protein [Acidobacteriota bacterium]